MPYCLHRMCLSERESKTLLVCILTGKRKEDVVSLHNRKSRNNVFNATNQHPGSLHSSQALALPYVGLRRNVKNSCEVLRRTAKLPSLNFDESCGEHGSRLSLVQVMGTKRKKTDSAE